MSTQEKERQCGLAVVHSALVVGDGAEGVFRTSLCGNFR